MTLSGKRVLVTGGSRGIGQAVADHIKLRGGEAITIARSNANLNFNVARPSRWVWALDLLDKQAKGKIDGLVTCAGILGPIGKLEDRPTFEIERCINVNLYGTILALRYCLPRLKSSGGRAVTFAGGGDSPLPRYDIYKSTKAAVISLTQNIAAEGEIEINCVSPGFVTTSIHKSTLAAGPRSGDNYESTLVKMGDGGRPMSEVTDLVCFLLSDASKGTTGQLLREIP